MNHRTLVLVLALLVAALAWSNPLSKRTVFSSVSGQVLEHGQPVAGLELLQRYDWLSVDAGEARTVTDAQGRFRFPAVQLRKLRAPRDILITQEITARRGDRTVTLWSLTKTSTGLDAELGGQPIDLTAHLDGPEREVKIPVSATEISVISGVSQLNLPYLRQLQQAQAQLSADGVARALQRMLSTPAGLAQLNRFFPAVGDRRVQAREVTRVDGVELSDMFLYAGAKAERYAAREAPSHIGFCTRARVTLALTAGEPLSTTFFAWTLLLPLDAGGALGDALSSRGTWEVDTRDYLKGLVKAAVDPARLRPLLLRQVQREPGERLLEAFGSKATAAKIRVEDLSVDAVEVDAVKEDTGYLQVRGAIRVHHDGQAHAYDYRGATTVALSSLASADYREAAGGEAPRLRLIQFQVGLKTDKKVYHLGEPITLSFTVTNLMACPTRFLMWHTPFEGFRNDFLQIARQGGGEVGYSGALVSRAPPDDDSYLALAPGASRTSEIEITQAYPIAEKGAYTLSYRGLIDAMATSSTEFLVE